MDSVIILDSARKHGISDEDIIHALTHAIERISIDGEPNKYLYLGFNAAMHQLELITVEMIGERVIVIHAMKARKSTLKWIKELKRGK